MPILRAAITTCLLASLIIPALAPGMISTRNDLTTTSFQTVTTSYFSNSTTTGLTPISYLQSPFDYEGSTGRFHLANEVLRPPKIFGMRPMPEFDFITCWYFDYFVFHGSNGEEIRGVFASAPYSVRFHIMSLKQFDYWNSNQYTACQPRWLSLLNETGSSNSFDWTVPQDGDYVFLFSSRVNGGLWPSSTSIHFIANMVSSSVIPYTLTSTLVETTTVTSIETNSTVTSTSTSLPPTQSTAAIPWQLFLLGALVVVLAIVFILTARHRQAK